jgi:hypothetical protein
MWEAIVHSILGDKNKGWQRELRCPYMLCPSNQPFVGAYPPKMKFVQKIQPSVYQYRCKSCGCMCNVSVEIAQDGQESYKINPALISQKPSYQWRR